MLSWVETSSYESGHACSRSDLLPRVVHACLQLDLCNQLRPALVIPIHYLEGQPLKSNRVHARFRLDAVVRWELYKQTKLNQSICSWHIEHCIALCTSVSELRRNVSASSGLRSKLSGERAREKRDFRSLSVTTRAEALTKRSVAIKFLHLVPICETCNESVELAMWEVKTNKQGVGGGGRQT